MFKVRQVLRVVLYLAHGIFEALKEVEDFSQVEERVYKLAQQAAGYLLVDALEELDNRLLAQRGSDLRVIGKRARSLLTSMGEITINRRLYLDAKGCYHILLDQALGLAARQRVSPRLIAMFLDVGTEVPFRRAARILGYLVPTISAMTIWNKVKAAGEEAILEAAALREAVYEKGELISGAKETEALYIEADEVWVRRQRGSKKGLGLKLVVGYEGKLGEKKSLINKKAVAGLTDGAGIWEETGCVFAKKWSLKETAKIRIGGDGAAWIKKGLEHFPGSSYHLDPFHLRKRICEALSFSSVSYEQVSLALGALDLKSVTDILDKNIKTSSGARRKRVKDLKTYLLSNWEGLALLPEEERLGAIEGQVRHTLTRRMKNIGARWTDSGANRMSRLLAAKANDELSRYTSSDKKVLGKLLAFETAVVKKTASGEEDLEAWLRVSMPALSGAHASRPWIKYILKELSKIPVLA